MRPNLSYFIRTRVRQYCGRESSLFCVAVCADGAGAGAGGGGGVAARRTRWLEARGAVPNVVPKGGIAGGVRIDLLMQSKWGGVDCGGWRRSGDIQR
jgi:hypothetical protein